MKIYCGIDFHKRRSTICFVDEFGKSIETVDILSESLTSFFRNRRVQGHNITLIGIEATGGSNHVVEELTNIGHDVRIINPNRFKAIGIGGKKTDERDAQALAEILRVHYAPTVHHKNLYSRQAKSLLVSREHVVSLRVDTINHIRGQLREYGITIPQGADKFVKYAPSCIERLENKHLKKTLKRYFELVLAFIEEERAVEKEIEEYVANDARIAQLITIPGIGLKSAVALTSVIDDVSRFKNAKHFASYVGLVPSEHSSGEKQRYGSVTKSGPEIARRYLIHGARSILRYAKETDDDPNKLWALRIKGRSGMNKATVAMAHRLARIVFSVLRDNSVYDPKKGIRDDRSCAEPPSGVAPALPAAKPAA